MTWKCMCGQVLDGTYRCPLPRGVRCQQLPNKVPRK